MGPRVISDVRGQRPERRKGTGSGAARTVGRCPDMPFRCASGEFTEDQEPTLEALLAEPIVRLVLAGAGLNAAPLRAVPEEVRRRHEGARREASDAVEKG